MSIVSMKCATQSSGEVIIRLLGMEISQVGDFLSSLVDAGHYDYARMITNRVIGDPKMHAENGELVSYCNTFQTWLTTERVQKLEAEMIEAKEKTKEAMAVAVGAQSGVAMLGIDVLGLMARIVALEESKKHQEGPQDVTGRREIQSAPRATPSMRELGKKAGQKVIQEQQEKKQTHEAIQKRGQIQKDTVFDYMLCNPSIINFS